jgi:hypothetical protein
MLRAAFTLAHDEGIAVFPLATDASNLVGRSPDAAVSLADQPTVSRQHAMLRLTGGEFVLSHLSRTNPTLLNGERVTQERALADGDAISIGDARLVFHDLERAGPVGGPVCHHCGRQNKPAQLDCWHCGSALVNAATVVGGHSVRFRLVGGDGTTHDLGDGGLLAFDPDGKVQSTTNGKRAGISVQPGAVELSGDGVMINGKALNGVVSLATGDQLVVGDHIYSCIAR